nr:DNA repair protein RecN [Salinicoccus albus]
MLLRLNIKNFAVLKNIELEFTNGLTDISGESGSGKSMLIEAIRYLYGKRASVDDIRFETEGAVIEGAFDFPETPEMKELLVDNDIQEDELYIVRREIMQNRKSIIKINSSMITLGTLRKIMNEVISIHSQSSQNEALEKKLHIAYLDRFIGLHEEDILKRYKDSYRNYRALENRMNDLEYKDRNRIQQLELYQHQYDELASMNLVQGEEEQLEEDISYFNNYEKIHDTLSQMRFQLDSEYSPQAVLYEIQKSIDSLSKFDEGYLQFSDTILEAYHLLNELDSKVTADLSNIDYDEATFNDKQMRLAEINNMKRKYNRSYEELISLKDALGEDISQLENISQSFENLEAEKNEAFNEMESYAGALHNFRIERKHFLETRIRKELQELDMADSDFEIQVKEGTFNQEGYSDVNFLISANKGEPLKEMNQVASGGEISRVMLAIRTIFTEFDSHSLLILDEIDSGVSGSVATRMAEKMKRLAKTRQVLIISHLPQAAATSDHHLYVSKETVGERTVSTAKYLDAEAHVYEIARMLSGADVTNAALENAKTLISNSRQASV